MANTLDWTKVAALLQAAWNLKGRPPEMMTVTIGEMVYHVAASDYHNGEATVTVQKAPKGEAMGVEAVQLLDFGSKRLKIC